MKVLTYTLPHTKTQIKNHCHYFLHIPIQRNMTWHHIRVCCLSLLDCWGRRSRISMFPLRHHELFLLGSLKKFDNAVCTGFSRCRNFSGRTPRFTTWTFIITWINHHRLTVSKGCYFAAPTSFKCWSCWITLPSRSDEAVDASDTKSELLPGDVVDSNSSKSLGPPRASGQLSWAGKCFQEYYFTWQVKK